MAAAPPRLADYFDLVGGTSTGAVIAGALALGKSTSEIKDFYLKLAPRIFSRPFWRVPGLLAKFDAKALREEIDNIVRDRRLDSPDLITGLCVVTKRLDTGSPWILANNSRAPYWNSTPARPGQQPQGPHRQQGVPARESGTRQHRGAAFLRSGDHGDQRGRAQAAAGRCQCQARRPAMAVAPGQQAPPAAAGITATAPRARTSPTPMGYSSTAA